MQASSWRVPLTASIASGLTAVGVWLGFTGLEPNPDLTGFGSLLASLLFASAILERALDVWLSITMGDDADRLDGEIRSLKAEIDAGTAAATAPDALKKLIADRGLHQAATRRLAMPVAVAVAVAISAVGLRCLQPLFTAGSISALPDRQRHFFVFLDILVTGTLLAGGSDGIHWIVALYRDWTDKNRSTKS
jgi:hypothetical protein